MGIFSACQKPFFFLRLRVCLILFLIGLLIPTAVIAHGDNQYPNPTGGEINKALEVLTTGRILPGSPLYFLIASKEFFSRLFQPSAAQRAEFDFVLAGKRLKEAYLTFEKGKDKIASDNLIKYQKRLTIMLKQLKRARSQNQDITKQIDKISDDFAYHQTLLLAISSRNDDMSGNVDFAINGFLDALEEVDKIDPGIKDRYKIFKTIKNDESNPIIEPEFSPIISNFPEVSTPSAKPRRIIY